MSLVACEICGAEVPPDLLERHRSLDELDLRERRRLDPGEAPGRLTDAAPPPRSPR